jgi:hypothetical protein
MGLRNSDHSPCLFLLIHLLKENLPFMWAFMLMPLFILVLVIRRNGNLKLCFLDLMGQVSHFLGIGFTWKYHDDGYLTVSLTQQSFADDLIEALGFASFIISTFLTQYHSGLPIYSVLHGDIFSTDRDALRLNYQSLEGSFNWLAHTTRPDLSTMVFTGSTSK